MDIVWEGKLRVTLTPEEAITLQQAAQEMMVRQIQNTMTGLFNPLAPRPADDVSPSPLIAALAPALVRAVAAQVTESMLSPVGAASKAPVSAVSGSSLNPWDIWGAWAGAMTQAATAALAGGTDASPSPPATRLFFNLGEKPPR